MICVSPFLSPAAAAHLETKGLDEGDASRLAAAFEKMGISDAGRIDVSLGVWGGWEARQIHCRSLAGSCVQQQREPAEDPAVCWQLFTQYLYHLCCVCSVPGSRKQPTSRHQPLSPQHTPTTQAHLNKFVSLKTPLSLEDWCSSFGRCPELLSVSPQVLSDRLSKLKALMAVDDEQLVSAVTKAPSIMQHAPAEIAEKVRVCWCFRAHVGLSGSGVTRVCTLFRSFFNIPRCDA